MIYVRRKNIHNVENPTNNFVKTDSLRNFKKKHWKVSIAVETLLCGVKSLFTAVVFLSKLFFGVYYANSLENAKFIKWY